MFEGFTERGRQVVALAQDEAMTLRHDHIGTEHLLLGLLREHEGLAAHVLHSFDITLERARGEVVRLVGVGTTGLAAGQTPPFAPDARGVLERASHEQRELGHNYIGTEHILLALLTLSEGVPMRILLDCDAKPDQVRQAVIRALSGAAPPSQPPGSSAAGGSPASGNGFEEWIRVGPGAGLRRLLMVAGARALDDGREDIQPSDVLLALTRDEHTGPLLAELGGDDVAIARALERRRSADQ
jgi:ATP-dependent Clp protease ATP-binding subunit ClpC